LEGSGTGARVAGVAASGTYIQRSAFIRTEGARLGRRHRRSGGPPDLGTTACAAPHVSGHTDPAVWGIGNAEAQALIRPREWRGDGFSAVLVS
jgi:hypothetical protein